MRSGQGGSTERGGRSVGGQLVEEIPIVDSLDFF